jgi:hypothetical protein
MEKYLEMTIAQLKEEAKERGIKGVSAMKKQELAELLDAADRMMEQKKKMAAAKKEVADKQQSASGPAAVRKKLLLVREMIFVKNRRLGIVEFAAFMRQNIEPKFVGIYDAIRTHVFNFALFNRKRSTSFIN